MTDRSSRQEFIKRKSYPDVRGIYTPVFSDLRSTESPHHDSKSCNSF